MSTPAKEMKPVKVYVFDHDQTLSILHTIADDGFCVDKEDPMSTAPNAKETAIGIMKQNARHPHMLRALFNKIKSNGDEFAIASYHDGEFDDADKVAARTEKKDDAEMKDMGDKPAINYASGPRFIRKHLQHSLNLSPELCQKIKVVAYMYLKPNGDDDRALQKQHGKNVHIEMLIAEINKENPNRALDLSNPEHRKLVCLIEDDKNNALIARKAGYSITPPVNADNIYDVNYLKFLVQDTGMTVAELETVSQEIEKEFAEDYTLNGRDSANGDPHDHNVTKKQELELVNTLITYVKSLVPKCSADSSADSKSDAENVAMLPAFESHKKAQDTEKPAANENLFADLDAYVAKEAAKANKNKICG